MREQRERGQRERGERGKDGERDGERDRERERERETQRQRDRERVRFSTPLSLVSSSNFGRAHSLLFLVMPSRWSNQQNRWGRWSWYGHWEPLNDADQSWTWSSSQKGDGEWKLVTRKRKKWASGTVSPGGDNSSSASSASSVDKSAIKAHRTFLEVVLGDSGSQPTKHSEPERQKLAAETTSRIEKIERLIALVGDDESLAGHKASLERDLAAAKKQVTKSSRPVAVEIEEKSKYISREKTRLQQLSETLRRQNLFWRHPQFHISGKRVVWPSCGRSSYQCRQIWTSTSQKSKIWSAGNSSSSVCWQSNVVQFRLPRNRKLFKTFKPRSRRNVAGEAGNSLHLCVISWNVAGIPLDDLDVWLQQVSDHFPWDLICLQEGFKSLNGIGIGGGHGIFTPCRHAIIVRSGSACDDVVFLASDTRWLAVRSESMKVIFVSLHLPHRRTSLVDSVFYCFARGSPGVPWCLQVCVWYGHKHSSLGLQRWAFDWKFGSPSVCWSVSKRC